MVPVICPVVAVCAETAVNKDIINNKATPVFKTKLFRADAGRKAAFCLGFILFIEIPPNRITLDF
jgi:hypothetical protein